MTAVKQSTRVESELAEPEPNLLDTFKGDVGKAAKGARAHAMRLATHAKLEKIFDQLMDIATGKLKGTSASTRVSASRALLEYWLGRPQVIEQEPPPAPLPPTINLTLTVEEMSERLKEAGMPKPCRAGTAPQLPAPNSKPA